MAEAPKKAPRQPATKKNLPNEKSDFLQFVLHFFFS